MHQNDYNNKSIHNFVLLLKYVETGAAAVAVVVVVLVVVVVVVVIVVVRRRRVLLNVQFRFAC
jgi:hypothetical protein